MSDDEDPTTPLLTSTGVQIAPPTRNSLREAGSIGSASPQERGLRDARTILEGGGSLRPLTSKQLTFVQAIIDGASPSEAYRFAYDAAHAKPSDVHQRSLDLQRLPHVAYEIYRQKVRQEERLLKDRVQAQRFVVEHLQRIVEMPGSHHSARVTALSLLGKYAGLFGEAGAAPAEKRSNSQVENELVAKLRAMLGDNSITIDGGSNIRGSANPEDNSITIDANNVSNADPIIEKLNKEAEEAREVLDHTEVAEEG
jgi:hypothetical protein